jgi:excisionase family DNA binding protein
MTKIRIADVPRPALAIPRREVARTLSLSLSTVDRAIKRGDLRAKKYGTRVMVPIKEVERFAGLDKDDPPAERT